MNQKTELYGLLAIGAIAVIYLMTKGGSSGSGLSFAQADPKSVAAVENANTSIAQSYNQTTLQSKMAAVDLAKSKLGTDSANFAKQSDSFTSIQEALLQSDVARSISRDSLSGTLGIAQAQADTAKYVSDSNNNANIATSQIANDTLVQGFKYQSAAASEANLAAVQEAQYAAGVATVQAGVAKDISNNATTQARIGKKSWFDNLLNAGSQAVADYFKAQT